MDRPALIARDLMGMAYEVEGTPYEIIRADPERTTGRWKQAGPGWYARRTPAGRERTGLIVGPCETPEQALDALLSALTPRQASPTIHGPLTGLYRSRNPHGRRG